MAGVEQVLDEEKKLIDKLAFVDGDALHALADFLLRVADCAEHLPRVSGSEFNGAHFAAAVGIAALDHAGTALGVVARLEHQDVLLGVLAPHIGAAQQFGSLVAAHRSHHQFELALHVHISFDREKAASRATKRKADSSNSSS